MQGKKMKATSDVKFGNKTKLVPGQSPANPHPRPNSKAPMISLASISDFAETSKLDFQKGYPFLSIK